MLNTLLQRRAYDAKDSDSHQNTEVRLALLWRLITMFWMHCFWHCFDVIDRHIKSVVWNILSQRRLSARQRVQSQIFFSYRLRSTSWGKPWGQVRFSPLWWIVKWKLHFFALCLQDLASHFDRLKAICHNSTSNSLRRH